MGTKLIIYVPCGLSKAGTGEGSRGGHVIGHANGKPIYDHAHAKYAGLEHNPRNNNRGSGVGDREAQMALQGHPDFTMQDHADAAAAHNKNAAKFPARSHDRVTATKARSAHSAAWVRMKIGKVPEPGGTQKSSRLFSANFVKARTHKYISRERKGDRWVYTYAEPQTPPKAHSAPEPEPAPHPAPSVTPAAPVAQHPNTFESKSTLEHPWTGVALALAVRNLPKKDFETGWFDHRKRDDADEATVAFQKMGYLRIAEAIDNMPAGLSYRHAANGLAAIVSTLIDEARTQHLNGAADGFAKYYNAQFASKTKTSVNAAPQILERAANDAGLTPQSKMHAARMFIEGKSIDMAVGAALDIQNGGSGQVSLADVYKNKSKRIGPDNAAVKDSKQALQALVQNMGIRDVSLGKALSQDEKEHHLQQCALGLADMTTVLGLPEVMASFNSRLSLDISSTGKGNALATYKPYQKLITLKRDSGAGSLAHEWGHFFDNVVGTLVGGGAFLSVHVDKMNAAGDGKYAESMPQGAMQAVFSNPSMQAYTERLKQSPGYMRATAAQRRYLRSPEELWARVFEAHVAHKLKQVGQVNTYLVAEYETNTPLYPNDAEIGGISAAIDKVFDTFKNSDLLHKAIRLMTRGLFSIPADMRPAPQTLVRLSKARTHKYISRERKGDKWVYTYAEPQTPPKAHSAPEPQPTPAPAPAPIVAQPGTGSKATLEHPWTDVAIQTALKNYPKDKLAGHYSLVSDNPEQYKADKLVNDRFHKLGLSQLKQAAESVPAGASWQEANDIMKTAISALLVEARSVQAKSAVYGLAKYYNSQFASRAKGSAHGTPQILESLAKKSDLTQESKLEAAKIYLSGKSADLAVGRAKDKQDGGAGALSLADVFSKQSLREGPDELPVQTPQEAKNILQNDMRIRYVSFGSKLTEQEKEHHLKQCAIALTDMAKILGLPEAMVSFNGRLTLDISATGKASTLAHYTPYDKKIVLRRDGGAGSLAHEWGHFFDHILGQLTHSEKMMLSDSSNSGHVHYSEDLPQGAMEALFASPAMAQFMARMKQSDDYIKSSRSRKAYVSSTIEVWARIFESHVAHKLKKAGISNTYLVAGEKTGFGQYPNEHEIDSISASIDKVFDAFKRSDLLHKAIRFILNAAPAPTYYIHNKGDA